MSDEKGCHTNEAGPMVDPSCECCCDEHTYEDCAARPSGLCRGQVGETVKRYPTDPRGQLDAGSARDTRERPCPNTWCTRSEHEGAGPCVVAPRRKIEPVKAGR